MRCQSLRIRRRELLLVLGEQAVLLAEQHQRAATAAQERQEGPREQWIGIAALFHRRTRSTWRDRGGLDLRFEDGAFHGMPDHAVFTAEREEAQPVLGLQHLLE